jgi:molybdenum cofactor sulfurtransferase
LSLYKMFGFPDLGAVIVKKSAADVFERRRFFGGGTVDMVVCLGEQWHAKKAGPLHERLEDGTLPVHSIVALKAAMQTHEELFGTLDRVSKHTTRLAKELYDGLVSLKHSNDAAVCAVYKDIDSTYGDVRTQGPVIAFNLRDVKGNWVSNAEVEKLAAIKNIHLRTGGVCNPGGIAASLHLAPWEMRENFSSGHRCGSENDILNGKPTGVIRVSLGAMSTCSDVSRFLEFLKEFFVCREKILSRPITPLVESRSGRLYVESLTVYPVKSCAGWQVPPNKAWEIRSQGLAWDREWCVVHQGTGKALSQKQHSRMALVRPKLDLQNGLLRISAAGSVEEISVRLSRDPSLFVHQMRESDASVCGEPVAMHTYSSSNIAEFFTKAIGVPCTLARYNPASALSRHSKPHLQPLSKSRNAVDIPRPLALSNESPILTITRSSLNRLNEQIKSNGGKAARPSVFRANIVLAEDSPGQEQPWAEDEWKILQIGGDNGAVLDVLGGCRRCQMVCVDQETAQKDAEPFVTLAKTRRFGGRVLFGVHGALGDGKTTASVKVGDVAQAATDGEPFDIS